MKNIDLKNFVLKSLAGKILSLEESLAVLARDQFDIIALISAAYEIRKKYFGNEVLVHILDNVQNGGCTEDCRYCAQSCLSSAEIVAYPQKRDKEILAEAQHAYESGAFRHCLVFSGARLSDDRIEHLCGLVREMRQRFPMEICVSPGFVTESQARQLKEAGLNRINHNLNTSKRNYPNICASHSYDDRLATIKAARAVGLDVCSGVIVGMGETAEDLIDVAQDLREMNVASIPVNFLLPIPGIRLPAPPPQIVARPRQNKVLAGDSLTPEFCLRVLCLFRFLNPRAEIRMAAGREYHLRSLEVLGLYPANSLFLDGYLNAKGSSSAQTLQMIKDAGFSIRSEHGSDETSMNDEVELKGEADLRRRVF